MENISSQHFFNKMSFPHHILAFLKKKIISKKFLFEIFYKFDCKCFFRVTSSSTRNWEKPKIKFFYFFFIEFSFLKRKCFGKSTFESLGRRMKHFIFFLKIPKGIFLISFGKKFNHPSKTWQKIYLNSMRKPVFYCLLKFLRSWTKMKFFWFCLWKIRKSYDFLLLFSLTL